MSKARLSLESSKVNFLVVGATKSSRMASAPTQRYSRNLLLGSPSHAHRVPFLSTSVFLPTNPSFSPSRRRAWSRFARLTNPGPPSPPPPPPPGPNSPREEDTGTIQALEANFYRIRDRVQIFFAVLFWMSLFFWSSAWDGRNSGGRGKGFRR